MDYLTQPVKKRSVYLDVIKGIAIFLVVMAHSIQWGSGKSFVEQELYFSEPVFKFIYGFHMPLFMVASGYLFWGTLNRRRASDVLRSRLRMLLLPIVMWQTLYLIVLFLAGQLILTPWVLFSYKGALWFLWSVLFCSVLVMAGRMWFHDSWLYYVCVMVGLLFVPARCLDGLHVYMIPYFFGGYWWNKKAGFRVYFNWTPVRKVVVGVLSLALFMLLYFVYDTPAHSVYKNGTCLLDRDSMSMQAVIDMARYVYGWAGVVMAMIFTDLLMPLLQKCSCLTKLGRNTLGIYITNYFAVMLMPLATDPWIMGLQQILPLPLIALAETLLMLALSLAIVWLIRCNKVLRLIMLGEK